MIDRKTVLKYVNEKKHVTIQQMCQELSISPSTARRTVIQLEDEGKIGRFRGGAFSLHADYKTLITTRQNLYADKKSKIAKTAAVFIEENSTVILLSGSTVGYICRYIKKMNITVITNSLIVLDELKSFPNIRLIVLGGLYNHDEAELGGIITNLSLGHLRADRLFMGCSGFDEKHGFTNRNYSVELYRACIQACQDVCVLVDSSKYNQGGVSIAATPEQVKYLITDSDLSGEVVERFEKRGISVILT